MKLNEMAWANALAVMMGAVYIFCAVAVAIFPGISRVVATSWFHGMDLGAVWTGAPRGNFFLGLVTAMGLTWLAGWVFALTYNKLARK